MAASNDDILRELAALDEKMVSRMDAVESRLESQSARIGDVAEGVLAVLTRVIRLEEQVSVLVTAFWQHRHGPTGDVEV